MSWIKKIFNRKKQNEDLQMAAEESMLEKLDASISNCQAEISKAENEKDQIRNWAIDAIRESFEVPKQYWYEELRNYNEIRGLDVNKGVSPQVLAKCNEVVQAYLDEIALREAKIKLYNNLIAKYQANREKMLQIKKQQDQKQIANNKLQALEQHSKRIEQLRNDPDNLNKHLNESEQLKLIKDEVNEVYDEFEINEEVRAYMLKLNEQFKSSISFGSKDALAEIAELMKKLEKE